MLIWYLGIWLHLDIDSQWAVKPVLVPATSTTAEDWNYPIVFPNGNWGIVATVSTTQLSHTLPDGTQAVSVIADNSINERSLPFNEEPGIYGKLFTASRMPSSA